MTNPPRLRFCTIHLPLLWPSPNLVPQRRVKWWRNPSSSDPKVAESLERGPDSGAIQGGTPLKRKGLVLQPVASPEFEHLGCHGLTELLPILWRDGRSCLPDLLRGAATRAPGPVGEVGLHASRFHVVAGPHVECPMSGRLVEDPGLKGACTCFDRAIVPRR